MSITKEKNNWRLISVVLTCTIFIGLYYFFKVYPQQTEQSRLQFAEKVLSAFFWIDIADRNRIYQAIFDQGLILNPVNDEIFIKDLNNLSMLHSQNEGKSLFSVLERYVQYSSSDMSSVKALCLQMKFVKAYSQKIIEQNYTSQSLSEMQRSNVRNLELIQPWLTNLESFEQFYKSKKMIVDC